VVSPVVNDASANYTPGASERRNGVTIFFHSGIKNTDVQTNVSEAAAALRVYDAFGNELSSTGTFQSPFGYGGGFGYQEDADYGVRLLGRRYYAAETGRFLTRDPVQDGRNWYSYGAGEANPITGADPTGLMLMAALAAIAVSDSPGTIPFGGRGGSP